MSTEIELKFRIPPERLAAVRRAVATATARQLPLAAVYVDTAGEHLAQARMALRLRREGAVWVQTLKAEGATAMQRLEHNVTLDAPTGRGGPASPPPALDLRRHDGTEAGAALRRVLAGAGDAPLAERYATEVQRTQRVLRQGGAVIELALDEGHLRADDRRLALCELEFELLSGPPSALLDLARRWVDRFGLVLDTRSKSERGHLLALARPASPPAKARPLRLAPGASPAQAVQAMLANALGQVLANASVLADGALGLAAAEPEYLHQLRVGLRRLRGVMKVFAPLVPPAGAALAPALATLFGQLGAARDRDAQAASLWPALHAAGAPWVDLPPLPVASGDPDLATLLCAPATQALWLDVLALCQPASAEPGATGDGGASVPTAAKALRRALGGPLRTLHHQVRRDAARFADLDDARRHRLRRRIKRLRYAAELAAAAWPDGAAAEALQRLQQAQAPLGDYNDTGVALAAYHALAASDPRAWFAVGWLSARRAAQVPPCAEALARLAEPRGFWRKG